MRNQNNINKIEKEIILESLIRSAEKIQGDVFANTLLTESEKITVGRRILIAHLLLKGETQREICGKLSVSPNTVSLSRKWLTESIPEYGAVYTKVRKTAETEKNKRNKSPYKTTHSLTFSDLHRKYPGHFLLFSIADELLKKLEK